MANKFNVILALVLVLCSAAMARAQIIRVSDVDYRTGVIPVQAPTQEMFDYFDAGKDAYITNRLRSVERYHMTREVIESIGSGKYPLGDIDFILRYFPNHPNGLQLLTTIAVLSKNSALAVRYFEKALALYPNHALTHAQYGHFFVSVGDLENGIQSLKRAVEMDPKLTAGYVWLAQAYEKKGDFEAARQASARAKELGYKGQLPASK